MDVQLAKTFLEVIAAGNFVNAAKRLFITQSAVSLRIQKLEDALGQPLFIRSKAGIELTPAGQQFERYARAIAKVWEDAVYQVGIPEGYTDNLIIGSQYSLWPAFGFRWLQRLEARLPRVALRAELGMPDRLLDLMNDGVLDIGIMYTPQIRRGLAVETVFEDRLVLVSTDRNYSSKLDHNYVFIDWGAEFTSAHKLHFPNFQASHTTLSLGAMSVRYLLRNMRAGYLPARVAQEYLDRSELHIVADAAVFPYPAYAVWDTEKDSALIDVALGALRETASNTVDQQDAILEGAGVKLHD